MAISVGLVRAWIEECLARFPMVGKMLAAFAHRVTKAMMSSIKFLFWRQYPQPWAYCAFNDSKD